MNELQNNNKQVSTIKEMEAYLKKEWLPSVGVVATELPLLDYELYFRNHYVVRYNKVNNKYENATLYSGENGKSDYIVWNELMIEELMNDMIRGGAKRGKLAKDEVSRMLADSRLVPHYDPFKSYFESLVVDDFDYIAQFANYLKVEGGEKEQERWVTNFKKALVRTVKCAINEHYFNKHAIILYSSDQSVGKTSYIRSIRPPELMKYTYEGAIGTDKDSQTLLAKTFMINIDELANLTRVDLNVLKATLSKLSVNLRLPYAATFVDMPRRASFWGSTNKSDFLTDTQNVRWLVFNVASIDRSYGNIETGEFSVDINKMWGQAYKLYKEGYACELSKVDLAINEENNVLYSATSLEKELINTYFAPATSSDSGKAGYHRMQSSEIFELMCKLMEEDGKMHSLKNVRQNVFFSELSRLDGWKKVSLRIAGRSVSGYHFIVLKEAKEGELF